MHLNFGSLPKVLTVREINVCHSYLNGTALLGRNEVLVDMSSSAISCDIQTPLVPLIRCLCDVKFPPKYAIHH